MEIRHLDRLNIPPYAITAEALACYRNGTCQGIIAYPYGGTYTDWEHELTAPDADGIQVVGDRGYYFDSIFVSKHFWDAGYTSDFFRMPITEAYVEPYGCHDCLPSDIWAYSMTPEPKKVPIDMTGCTVVGDLCKRLHWYHFEGDHYGLVSAADAEKNLTRYAKQYEIFKQLGNDGARIADYAKILAYVLSVLAPQLPPAQAAMLQPFINGNAPDDVKLQSLMNREKKILNIAQGLS